MKLFNAILMSLLVGSAWGSSSVDFKIKHQEIRPYPGNAWFVLNGPTGIRSDVAYTLTCKVSNPNQEAVVAQLGFDPYRGCPRSGCGALTLNGTYTQPMMHFQPGMNEFKLQTLITPSYNPNTMFNLTNFDNDNSIYLESCIADLE